MARKSVGFGLIFGIMALVALLATCVGLWLLARWLQPEPQAPGLARERSEPVTTRFDDGPAPAPEPPPSDREPSFNAADHCPLTVLLAPEDDAEIGDAYVRATMAFGSPGMGERHLAEAQSPNRWLLADLPCGVADVKVTVEGYVPVRRENVDSVVEQSVTIPLTRGVTLRGLVMDEDGEPIVHARVRAELASDLTEEDGRYELLVDPAELRRVAASAEGYLNDSQRLRLPEDSLEDAELDFLLVAAREVTVWCAGLPDDSCASVLPLMCTYTLLPWGSICMGDPVTCDCPVGRVAIRGGGQAVEVPAEASEAWLDFRDTGSVTGRVVRHGEPTDCEAMAVYLPATGIPDLTKGIADVRKGSCDLDGRFLLEGLAEGRWNVDVTRDTARRSVQNIAITAGQRTDIGELDLMGGGVIEGVVLDALTDQGAPGVMVMAIRTDLQAEVPAMQMATSGAEGRFTIRGLDDGGYAVATSARPFTRESVEVDGGEADREVVLTTGAASLLDENGFSLVTDDEGELMVDLLDPGGFADAAGLQEGDIIDGVLVGGVDLAAMFPGLEDHLVENVLEHYGGPGVSLRVIRDGEEEVVELE